MDGQHRGDRKGRGRKCSELEFSFVRGPVERGGSGSLGRAESAARLVAAALASAARCSAPSAPASELVRRVNAEGELGIAQ